MYIDYIDPDAPVAPEPEPRRNRLPQLVGIAIAVFVLFSPGGAMTALPLLTMMGIYGFAFFYVKLWKQEPIWGIQRFLQEHVEAFRHPVMAVRVIFIASVAVSVLGTLMLLFGAVAIAGRPWLVVAGVVISGIQIVWAGYSLAAYRNEVVRAEQDAIISGLRNALVKSGVRRALVKQLNIDFADDVEIVISNPPAQMLDANIAAALDAQLRAAGACIVRWDDEAVRVGVVIPESVDEGLEIPASDSPVAQQPAYAPAPGVPASAPAAAPGAPAVIDLSDGRWES
jgi:hypothetical protein